MGGGEIERHAMEIRKSARNVLVTSPVGCPHCQELSTNNAAGHIRPSSLPPTVFVRTCVDVSTVLSSQRSHVSLTPVCLRSGLCVHTLRVVTL